MSFFRTVLGDIPSEEMGLTYSHEHIIIDESFPTAEHPEFLLNDVEKVTKELKSVYDKGGRTMVDTMPANCGRNVLKLAEVSQKSKIQIIAPTGIHLEIYYPPGHWRYHYNEDQLTRLFIADIEEGIDRYDYSGPVIERTDHRAGMIKLATGDEPFSDHQRLIFRAVVNAHLATGVPILTHTNFGRWALEQALLFKELGADLRHVVLSHVDRCVDIEYHKKVLDTGVRVEYDSAFRWKPPNSNATYQLLQGLLPDYKDQITMGMDAAKHTYWRSYGGNPGLDFLLTTFKDDLKEMELSEYFENIFYNNPQKLYSFKK